MTNESQSGRGELFSNVSGRFLLIGVIGITLLGFYLRYRCLGCLGFRWDEDLTSLAVKSLLDNGVPDLPSGMIYFRFYPYQWIIAAPVTWFGFSEFSTRLPAVFFGTALIPTAYWIAAKFFDKQTGLIVAACIALSFWQVEISRTARMYAPFFLVYLFAAYAIFRAHFQDTDKLFSPWVLPLALLALSIHQLAYSLAILLLLAIPLNNTKQRTASLLVQAAGTGIAFLAIKSLHERYFDIPLRNAELLGTTQATGEDAGLIGAILQQISLPNFELLSQVCTAYPIAALLSLILIFAATVWLVRAASGQNLVYRTLIVFAIALSIAHQFNLVLFALATMLILLKGGIAEIRNPAWSRPAVCCLAILILWLAVVAMLSLSSHGEVELATEGFRKLLRTLIDYPNFRLFWSFILERPVMAVPLALGTLWGIDKIARDRPDPTALFVLGSFWLVVFVNGILETKFEFFRYNLHVDPFFLMLAVTGLFAVPDLLMKLGLPRPGAFLKNSAQKSWLLAVAVIAIIGVNPVSAILTSARDYSESSLVYALLGLDSYEDFKTPAAYVRERLEDDDIILVLDPREYWNYIGRVDYWIRSSNYESQTYRQGDVALDRYLGIPLLHTAAELREVVEQRGDGNVWILFSIKRLKATPFVADEIKAYLGSMDEHIVYVGRDKRTMVMRLAD
jgi:hypothetical protein